MKHERVNKVVENAHNTRYKKLWAAVWINNSRFGVASFANATLTEAATLTMREYRQVTFWRFAHANLAFRTSKHAVAVALRKAMGIPELSPLRGVGFELGNALKEAPEWVLDLPIEEMIQSGIIDDPAVLIKDQAEARVFVSTKYRDVATKRRLRSALTRRR